MRRNEVWLAIFILGFAIASAAVFQNCVTSNTRDIASVSDDSSEFSKDPTGGLPTATHQLSYGYYFADGRYGDFRSEVDCYTNLYIAWARRGYELSGEESNSAWLPRMKASMQEAFIAKKNIYLNLNLQDTVHPTPVDDVLKISKGVWSQVVGIELASEPSWDKAETESKLNEVRTKIHELGLTPKTLGVVYTDQQVLESDAVTAEGLGFVGVEAYLSPPGKDESGTNVSNLTEYLKKAFERIPPEKKIALVGMAYARNGNWTNLDTLKDLQTPPYVLAHDNPRIFALTMFSYGRPSGTREHAETLKSAHVKIGNAALKRTCRY